MIRVQEQDFDIGLEVGKLTDGNTRIGGVCFFVGLVRDFAGDQDVSNLTLEHYPGMTEKQLQDVEAEAQDRWPLEASLIIHRFGKLAAGDNIVMVAAASEHRAAAFEACQFLMDWLKTKAPFWKKESSPDGAQWVAAKADDEAQAERWNTPKKGS